MSEEYVKNNFDNIKKYADIIEKRLDDDCRIEELIEDNRKNLRLAKEYNLNYVYIDEEYKINIE